MHNRLSLGFRGRGLRYPKTCSRVLTMRSHDKASGHEELMRGNALREAAIWAYLHACPSGNWQHF